MISDLAVIPPVYFVETVLCRTEGKAVSTTPVMVKRLLEKHEFQKLVSCAVLFIDLYGVIEISNIPNTILSTSICYRN